jgi:carbon storage regulator
LYGRASTVILTDMLVLSRKAGERVFIGDQISVTVVRIAPGVVRIGIDAPAELAIVREELMTEDKVEAEGKNAGVGDLGT